MSHAKFSLSKNTVVVTFNDVETDTAALIAATNAIGFPTKAIEYRPGRPAGNSEEAP